MITEDHRDIPLHTPSFSVDGAYEVPAPLPKQAHFAAFLGPPRSGKTSLATALLSQVDPKLYHGQFHHVYLVCPKPSFDSMTASPYLELAPHKVKHEFDQDTMADIVARLEASSKRSETSLVIIDDFMSNLKDTPLRKSLERLVANRRHLRCSVWIISQTYNAIPLSTRKLLTAAYMFRPANTKETENIRSELVMLPRPDWEAMVAHVFGPGGGDSGHAFMFIDLEAGAVHNRFSRMRVG